MITITKFCENSGVKCFVVKVDGCEVVVTLVDDSMRVMYQPEDASKIKGLILCENLHLVFGRHIKITLG